MLIEIKYFNAKSGEAGQFLSPRDFILSWGVVLWLRMSPTPTRQRSHGHQIWFHPILPQWEERVSKSLSQRRRSFWENLQRLNQNWFDRMKSEAPLAFEFAAKLAGVHSIPETANIFQEWTSRRMETAAGSEIHGDETFVVQELAVQRQCRQYITC
jgi:hypothetical protein